MITLEQVLYIIPVLALATSLLYYAKVIQHQNKTRELQLYMQIMQKYQDPEFHHNAGHIMLNWEWTDYEDFHNKYGLNGDPESWTLFDTTMSWLDSIGLLVKRGHIDAEIVNETLFHFIERGWEKFSPIIYEMRKEMNYPHIWVNYEYLYKATKPLNEELRRKTSTT